MKRILTIALLLCSPRRPPPATGAVFKGSLKTGRGDVLVEP
jgi:hypothetical protein